MKEQKKKRIISLLLLVACMVSGYMLFIHSGGVDQQLKSPARVDSLIQTELGNFNIGDKQIRISSTQVDSTFSRKIYHLAVPYQFSKTQFHAELNRRFHPYSVKTPATVTFPQEDMDIHLLYHNTVIRTVSIQTDPDLIFNQNRISLLILFENMPGEKIISQIQRLGEPIPIVLKIKNPMQANAYRKKLGNKYSRVIFWLQNENGIDHIKADRSNAITKLKQLQEILPEATMLYRNESDQAFMKDKKQLITRTKMTFVDAVNALMLREEMGKSSFLQNLDKLQSSQLHSMAVINGNDITLSWLNEKLPELKKGGANIIAPPKTNL